MKRALFLCAVAGCVFLADALSLRGLPEGRWTHPVSDAQAASASTAPAKTRSSRPDSVQLRVESGEVLVTTLPERVAGRPVAAYRMLRTPALSDLAGRSFFWRTRPQDAGSHRLLFAAQFDTTAAASVDTLVMRVAVE